MGENSNQIETSKPRQEATSMRQCFTSEATFVEGDAREILSQDFEK